MLRFGIGIRNVISDAVANSLGSGTISIYTGTQPASADDAATGTLLVSIVVPDATTMWAAASNGARVKTAAAATGTAVSSGTAGWARFTKTTASVDGSVTATGAGGNFTIDNTSIVSAMVYSITGATITAAIQ